MPRTISPDEAVLATQTIACLSMDAVEKANSGHPGTPMALADIGFQLFASEMRHAPNDPNWVARDRFVLSAGHASMLLYSLLHLTGYGLALDELKNFRQWGTRTPGHPEVFLTPGVETTTGPLGQGISNAVGFALAARMKAARFGELFASRVFVIASDGDVMEGVSGEASSLAGLWGLSNLVVFYDDNRITIDGTTEISLTEDVGKRYEAYGFRVERIDGHDHAQIQRALDAARGEASRPTFIVARTHIAKGAPNAHDTPGAHGAPLGKDEIGRTKSAMGWDPDASFVVPAKVSAFFETRRKELEGEHAEWTKRYQAWRVENADLAKTFDAFEARTVPTELFAELVKNLPEKDDATRGLSATLEQRVAALVPSLVGGSADLAGSTKTTIKGAADIARGAFGGRNIHFGIREHAMGAICNGLALAGGFIPFASTFLVFSDYMRGSIRLSALMHLPCVWIFTHDSIFLGEDGPTHQPIEHLSALRVIPNLVVLRPADALECAAAWSIALGRTKGPTVFSLTRQKAPKIMRAADFNAEDLLRGAAVVKKESGKCDLVVLASGSEVKLACDAADELAKAGVSSRVVSVMSLEMFESQDEAWRNSLVPPGVPRVSIEAGRTNLWRGIVGEGGLTIGIDTFGASAPDNVLADKFGLTTAHVRDKILAWRK